MVFTVRPASLRPASLSGPDTVFTECASIYKLKTVVERCAMNGRLNQSDNSKTVTHGSGLGSDRS
jgi:hypothetical protein